MEKSVVQGPVTIVSETVEKINDSNINPSPETNSEHINEGSAVNFSQESQKKRRPKPDIQEDNTIDDEFASRLDVSCAETTVAPSIVGAYVSDYAR